MCSMTNAKVTLMGCMDVYVDMTGCWVGQDQSKLSATESVSIFKISRKRSKKNTGHPKEDKKQTEARRDAGQEVVSLTS